MQKILFVALLLSLSYSCSSHKSKRNLASNFGSNNVEAYMSPGQGKEAFSKMYNLISDAKEEVNITVYSWSDSGFSKALHAALDKRNPPKVRVVMRKSVFAKHLKDIAELEAKGAMFKKAKIELHEKFILADSTYLVNSSANMSGGAKNRYSENFVFFNAEEAERNSDLYSIIRDFKQEFAIIWNSAHDHITEKEKFVADVLNHKEKKANKMTALKNLSLISSSMNYKVTAPSKRDFNKGSIIGLKRIPNKSNQIWMVKDSIIKAIGMAKHSIHLNINHFNLIEISDALIAATKRGVDVKLAVDSQEYKSRLNGKEMTPQFVQDWYKEYGTKNEAPVRIKFYSFVPHFSSWSLNHHKYIMIDYNPKPGNGTFLLTGSYNYSKTAEHSKFDNQVLFRSSEYQNIYDAFYEEFDYLWRQGRDEKDKPKASLINYFKTAKKDLLPLHSSRPVALTWKEAGKLKEEIEKLYPESRTFYKYKHCQFYNVKKDVYLNKDAKSECVAK
jgi:phosphatidylserine/phosphatidylglycerophosphate/cardiolipin synthase-like enzyme